MSTLSLLRITRSRTRHTIPSAVTAYCTLVCRKLYRGTQGYDGSNGRPDLNCSSPSCFKGTPHDLECESTASLDALKIKLERVSSNWIRVTFDLSAANPCVWGSCAIDGHVEVDIRNRCEPNQCLIKEYRLALSVDKFPNHDLRVNGESVDPFPTDICSTKRSAEYLCYSQYTKYTFDTGWRRY